MMTEVAIETPWRDLLARRAGEDLLPLFHLDPEDVAIAARLKQARADRLRVPTAPLQLPPLLEVQAGLGHWAATWAGMGGEAEDFSQRSPKSAVCRAPLWGPAPRGLTPQRACPEKPT